MLIILGGSGGALAQETSGDTAGGDLDLARLRSLVLQYNESLQMRLVEMQIADKAEAAEKGIFEPQVVASVDHTDSDRPNNTQQRANLGFFAATTPNLTEKNTLYNAGLEFLVPTGTRFRLGYTLRQLDNNLQYTGVDTNRSFYGPEYETFVGASLVQPLLKNFGPRATRAKIRLAALASEVAFQEYRRQSMLTLAQAESAYWDLYLAQEKARLGEESVRLSETIRNDNRVRLEVGKAPEIEWLQAEAGVALRRTRLNEHQQRVVDLGGRLASLYGATPRTRGATPRAIERPRLEESAQDYDADVRRAFEDNPDYRMRQTQLTQEGIRIQYTRNQRLPQLDLRASYGLNGLGLSIGRSWDNIDSQDHPAWSIGFEFRVPLGGGVKERNDYHAALLGKERALLGLKEVETQIFNGVDSAHRRLRLYAEDIRNYTTVAEFHERLLQTQLDRLAVGAVESRVVLETEERTSEARAAVIESQVLYRRALLELELIRGSILQARDAEIDRDTLRLRTREQVRLADLPVQELDELEHRAAREFTESTRLAPSHSN